MPQRFRNLVLISLFAGASASLLAAAAAPTTKTATSAATKPSASPQTALSSAANPPLDTAQVEFFELKVRPVLAKYCYSCHSQSANRSAGGLMLDSREAILTGGSHGPALVPGQPDASRIIDAVRYSHPDLKMPPGSQLPPNVIADLETWVKQGAVWPAVHSVAVAAIPAAKLARDEAKRKHWAWQPLKPPHIPAVQHKAWPKDPIDNFILAGIEQKGLTPAAYADRRTLIRRATFDLIGLPPTPEETAAFIADRSPDAWAKVVDRLLASPHYGERWGRFWLDIARYGEDQAHSFEPRLYPQGFRYRDWVANALNADMPYDRFLKEQIAADQIDCPDKQDQIAALGFFAMGPVYYGDQKMFDQYDDRIDTLSRGMLGLTVACARCHDHKFDPISQKDYYALAGVFASTAYVETPVVSSTSAVVPGGPIVNRNDQINKKSEEFDKFTGEQIPGIRRSLISDASRYVVATWKTINRRKAGGKADFDTIANEEKLQPFVLERWFRYLAEGTDQDRPLLADWRAMLKAQDPNKNLVGDDAALAQARKIGDSLKASVSSLAQRKESKAALTAADNTSFDQILGQDGILSIPKESLLPFLNGDPKAHFNTLFAELNRLKMGAFVHALTDNAKPVDLPVLKRGNSDTPGAVEPRHFITILANAGLADKNADPPAFTHGSGRLDLANALASTSDPLVVRVIVNRIWQHHFGVGLVRTASNFGMLGAPPTNPALLEYLSGQFIDSGWSLKKLHRRILLSATYQMSGAETKKGMEVDPDDRLLWRMPRKRLEVEAWRDAMLSVSGKINLTLGGPSLSLADDNNTRRTYYAAVSRHDLDEMLRLFDFPDPNATTDARMTTTVPLQQLFVLNSEFMVHQAKAFAARLTSKPDETDAQRLHEAFQLVYNRDPSPAEQKLAIGFLQGPAAGTGTKVSLTSNPAPPTADQRAAKLSRWEQYAQVLLSTNEFMYMD